MKRAASCGRKRERVATSLNAEIPLLKTVYSYNACTARRIVPTAYMAAFSV
jgi:hypothetical protein